MQLKSIRLFKIKVSQTRTKFDTTFNENITLPAGKYYIKAQTLGVDRKPYATGTVTIDPFVTNYITLEFE